jgi:UDP-N-acetylmuramate--alanine ligase
MTSMMLIEEGVDPTIHLGAPFDGIGGSTVRQGGGRDLLVSEACEFKRSFLEFRSTTAAITNIDHDHVDCYPTLDCICPHCHQIYKWSNEEDRFYPQPSKL